MENNKTLIADSIQLQIIYDNNLADDKLKEAWGFSCLVNSSKTKVLFDTGGDSGIFVDNLKVMNIDSDSIDAVIISHDHWDHNAGLDEFLKMKNLIDLYLLNSFSDETKEIAKLSGTNMIFADKSTEISPGIITTGSMSTDRPQLFEHSLIIHTDRGLIIITGCAHPGIVNIIEQSKSLIDADILFVLGGFHLVDNSAYEVNSIINRCLEMGIKYMAPCHCTGEQARSWFKNSLGDKFIDTGAGTIIKLENLD